MGALLVTTHGRLAAQVTAFEQFPVQPVPDSAAPLVPAYGFNDDEISIGAYPGVEIPAGKSHYWDWANLLGINILEMRIIDPRSDSSRFFDTLADNTSGRVNGRWLNRLIINCMPFDNVGWSAMNSFFAFDSSESFYWPCKFLQRTGGRYAVNAIEKDRSGSFVQERIYDVNCATSNQQVLGQMVMGWDSVYQKYRYPPNGDPWRDDDSAQHSGDAFYERHDLPYRSNTHHMWLAVKGHLFNPNPGQGDPPFIGPVAADNDPLFAIEIWTEIPRTTRWTDATWPHVYFVDAIQTHAAEIAAWQQQWAPDQVIVKDNASMPDVNNRRAIYLDSITNAHTHTYTTDTSILYTTVLVRKRDLFPLPDPAHGPNYSAYREPSYGVDMVRLPASIAGPWSDRDQTHRFDIRVRWTGREMAALRSITLRDSLAQLATGGGTDSANFYDTLSHAVEFILRGPRDGPITSYYDIHPTRPLRTDKIVRLYSGDEGLFTRNNMFNRFDAFLYQNPAYNDQTLSGGRLDTIRGLRSWRAQNGNNPQQYIQTSEPEISVETYPNYVYPELIGRLKDPDATRARFGLPPHIWAVPSIKEHNGGRMYNPLLDLAIGRGSDRDTVELYSQAWNRLSLGAYMNGHLRYPYSEGQLTKLGAAAWASRRTGRRLIQWPGSFSSFYLGWHDHDTLVPDVADTTKRHAINVHSFDTVFSHQIESSELRVLVNLCLAYGGRGIHWGYLGCNYIQYSDTFTTNGQLTRNYLADWGPVGPVSNETQENLGTVTLRTKLDWTFPVIYTVANLWVGRGSRQQEIMWIDNEWLKKVIGPEMVKLHWRDVYSIHFNTEQTYITAQSTRTQSSRPLPSNEIITRIEAYDRSGRKDSAMNTFVELGLFDPLKVKGEYDVNYAFVVNRRTFERPRDPSIDSTTPMGKHLDSLAEVRRLRIKLNLKHPDVSQYNFVHIEEPAPDMMPLVTGVAKRRLDTIVRADSAFDVWLRPGGAALLRFTFCRPNERVDTGDLRLNTQRKVCFDGARYHKVYFRKLKYWTPMSGPMMKTVPVIDDQIFYSRSLPIDAGTGAIRWDPRTIWSDVLVSDTNTTCLSMNRFPSLTVRADSSLNGDTVVTIVWTAHGCGGGAGGGWDVLTRRLLVDGDTGVARGDIEPVGFATGVLDSNWGVPVVSRLWGGEVFAWGDTLKGIKACLRLLNTLPNHLSTPGVFIPESYVSLNKTQSDGPGCHPSMPAFAHIWGQDSSIGLVWEQPVAHDSNGRSIMYERLVHAKANGNDMLLRVNQMSISDVAGFNRLPSIDMTQDVWAGAQEGVTWQGNGTSLEWSLQNGIVFHFKTFVHFRSLWTETSPRGRGNPTPGVWKPRWDSICQTLQWAHNSYVAADLPNSGFWQDVYPNTSSLNARIDSAHQNDSISFSVVTSRTPWQPMQQATVRYAMNFIWPQPKTYTIGGYYPNGSASGRRQNTLETVLFQKTSPAPGALETTREFFAKERPEGYMAQGRQIHFRVSEDRLTTISCGLHDVWFASDAASGALRLVDRAAGNMQTDTLSEACGLLRTKTFTTHDSTTIGYELMGHLTGDTSRASGMSVRCVTELIDASNDMPLVALDSFNIEPGQDTFSLVAHHDLDLLSGEYYVRLRILPMNLHVDTVSYASVYPVEEMSEWVGEPVYAKVTAARAETGRARISAQPNPGRGIVDVRYSVPEEAETSVRLYDVRGRLIRTVVEPTEMSEGRYSTTLDCSRLPAGTYMLTIRTGRNRASDRLVVE